MSVYAAWIREDLSEVRLLTPSGEVSWRAEEAPKDAETDAFFLRDRAKEAAAWAVSQLGGAKRLGMVCVDIEDAACVFASAPSADPEVVAAAMRSGSTDYDALTMRGHMQPLARMASKPSSFSSPTIDKLLKRGKVTPAAQTGALRMAVLATPDSLVRLWLDQLDRLGASVGVVISLWHALGDAWSDRATSASEGGAVEAQDIGPIDAVILEDTGRLVWSWMRGGNLIAAGELSIRRTGGVDPERWNSEAWFPVAASRLTLDWLTWSTHLGASPTKVRVIGSDAKDLSRLLDERWPHADVSATALNDPIGGTLRAIAQRDDAALPSDDDPRRTLVALSRRRGRAHAKLYTWAGVATGLCAVAVFAVGWRTMERRSQLVAAATELRSQVALKVQEVEPVLASNPDKARALDSVLQQLRQERPDISDPPAARPILNELARLSAAFEALGEDGLFFLDFDLNETLPNATVRVPDFATGERLREELMRSPGQIDWNVTFQREIGQNLQDWKLTGQWVAPQEAAR
jgi:hypothetical protein